LHQASNATGASPLTVWVTSNPNIKPQIGDQYALGYFRNLFKDVLEVSTEVYYKDMKNTIDFRDNAELILNEFLEGEFRMGNSYSYGVELLVRKNIGKLTGWVGYTWSRTRRKIPGINNGEEFFAPYDKTHDISVVAVYQMSKRVTLSSNWLYSSGAAISVPTGKYSFQGEQINVFSERNSVRMPSFHRWDISLTLKTKDKPNKKYKSEWAFSVLNTYFRKNAYNINFKTNEDTGKSEAIKTYFFPILPSIAYNIKF
jgi:outer membrane receptor protein involved in Fe transport